MEIYEIIKLGTWIKSDDEIFQKNATILINLVLSNFHDANIALNEFNKLQKELFDVSKRGLAPMKAYYRKKDELRYEITQEKTQFNAHEQLETIDLEVTKRLNRMAWERGQLPSNFPNSKLRIFARAFVYAIDGIQKSIEKIAILHPEIAGLVEIKSEFNQTLGSNKDIRDSAHHQEDRARFIGKSQGRGKEGKPFKPKTLPFDLSSGEGGVFTTGVLINNSFTYTNHKGDNVGIDISHDTMNKLCDIIHKTFNCFEWVGSPVYYPELYEWLDPS